MPEIRGSFYFDGLISFYFSITLWEPLVSRISLMCKEYEASACNERLFRHLKGNQCDTEISTPDHHHTLKFGATGVNNTRNLKIRSFTHYRKGNGKPICYFVRTPQLTPTDKITVIWVD